LSVFRDIADKLLRTKAKDHGAPLDPLEDLAEQSPDDKKIVAHIRSKIDLVRQTNSRIAIEGVYLTNVAYLLGFDGVYYDTTYRQFKNTDPKRKLTRSRFKVNKILPLIQNRLSRLTQSPPKYDVRPNSNSTEDKDSARLALQILNDVFDRQRFDEKRQELLMATMQGGHAYVQVLWDPTLGKPMIDPDSGELVGYEGDVRFEVLNCLEVFPDPLAKTIDECQWIIKAKVRKLEYFQEKYPERGHAVKEEDTWLLSSLYDLKSNALTSVGIVGAQTHDQMRDSAIELVYYEKRSKDYPNGRMIVCASGVLLEDKALPVGQYDIVKFDDMIIGGRYNSESVITHLRPIQDQYNVTRTKMAEWVRKLLAGKYAVPDGANLKQESLTNDTEVVEYTPVPNAEGGGMPVAMNIPQIPPYAYKDLETADTELDYISGVNEVSRGVLPSASIPASGLAFLQEQDQTRIGVQTTRNESGYARIGELALRYVGDNYVMPRLLKLAGQGLEYTVKEFVGADIRDNYDVIVVPGSTLPTSKVLRRQDIMTAWQTGLLGNPQDQKVRMKVFQNLEYGEIEDMWKEQALDEAQVKYSIECIEEGKIPPMDEFDNHTFHLMEMNNYRKTDKYKELDKAKQGIFKYVMEWHIQAMTGIMNPQIQQSRMMAEQALKQLPQQGQMIQNTINQLHPGSPQNQGQMPQMPQPAQAPQAPPPGQF